MLICSHSCFRLCVYVMKSTWLRIFLHIYQNLIDNRALSPSVFVEMVPWTRSPQILDKRTQDFYKSTRYTTGSCSGLVRNIYKHCHRPTKECGQFLITPHTCSCPSNRWTLLLIMLTQFGGGRHSNKWQVCRPSFFLAKTYQTEQTLRELNSTRKKSIMFVQYASW